MRRLRTYCVWESVNIMQSKFKKLYQNIQNVCTADRMYILYK